MTTSRDVDELRRLVCSGRAIATGYRRGKTKSRSPVIIPAAAFADAKISLLRNVVGNDDGSYGLVRVIRKNALDRQLRSERPVQSTRLSQIAGIIAALEKSGEFDGILLKQQVSVVSAALNKAGVAYSGTDANLGRLIRKSRKR